MQKWVNSRNTKQLSYLSGALEDISVVGEVVIGLFFTNWLQLKMKQEHVFAHLRW